MNHSNNNRVILSIGSNQESKKNMAFAMERLLPLFSHITFSPEEYTVPTGDYPPNPLFLNRVGIGYTSYNGEELTALFKQIEREAGRTGQSKAMHQIPLDIDLLVWNQQILKAKDMARDFVIKGIEAIENPEK